MTSTEVCNAIADVIGTLWPERIIYRDFCPVGHKRPSCYLYITKSRMENVSIGLVQWSMEAQLELFCATDRYDISSTEELRQEQEAVLLAFHGPSIQVGDRWLELNVQGDGMEMGSAFVVFTASWLSVRPGYVDPSEDTPMMEDYTINEMF